MGKIQLVTKPVIKHELKKIGESVTKRLSDLNIDNLVATEDTIQALKKMMSQLNKEFKDYETDRGVIKKAVQNPYSEFESEYNIEIRDKYKSSVGKLKDLINSYTLKVKEGILLELKTYFDEKKKAEELGFLKFNKVIDSVNISTTIKAYRKNIDAFFDQVLDDIKLINTNEYKDEIMVEYKKTMNATKSIIDVQNRKSELKKIEEEKAAKTKQDRIESLLKIGITRDDLTGVYCYDEDIHIDSETVSALSDEKFADKLQMIKLSIAERTEHIKTSESDDSKSDVILGQSNKPTVSMVSSPIEEDPKPVIRKAEFRVRSTFDKLKQLGQYMRDSGIEYENINNN